MQLFDSPAEYEAFERVLAEAHEWVAMRTLVYCVMPNHWHLAMKIPDPQECVPSQLTAPGSDESLPGLLPKRWRLKHPLPRSHLRVCGGDMCQSVASVLRCPNA